jgi:serine/threonine protein kinase
MLKLPFKESNDKYHMYLLKNPEDYIKRFGRNEINKNGLDLIIKLLQIDPNDRLSLEEIQNHAYMS